MFKTHTFIKRNKLPIKNKTQINTNKQNEKRQ